MIRLVENGRSRWAVDNPRPTLFVRIAGVGPETLMNA
jgi:hypothetical protein